MFALLPVGVDYRSQRYPIVTFTLIGINVVVYLVSLIWYFNSGERAEEWIFEHLWLIPSESTWYSYVTSLFVHGGFWHLFGNMVYLFLFGSCVEDTIGRGWYILFYFAGGIISNFAYIAASPEHFASDIPLGGASGAISACIGGFVLLFLKTKINFRYFILLFFKFWTGEFALPAWVVISFWFLKDLVFAVLNATRETSGGGVAFAAHVGGMLAGLAIMGSTKLKQRPSEQKQSAPIRIPSRIKAVPKQPATVYLCDAGAQSGPFTDYQVREMLNAGSVSGEAFYWEEGMPDWRSITEFSDRY
jgi:membrane associated rhomboid family serine protease